MVERKVERLHLIGIPICIGLYWVVSQSTSEWFVQCIAGIILFGGLSVIGRYLEREESIKSKSLRIDE